MIRAEIVEIARRASLGDARAFDELCEKKAKSVYWYARWMLKSEEDAKDAAQDTFLDMYIGIEKLRSPEAINVWILHIVRNNCRRQLLQRHRMGVAYAADEAALAEVEEPARSVLPETAALDQERRERLHAAIATLNHARIQTISLYYFAGMNCMQIGKKTGMTARAVAMHLHRARAKMRRILKDDD